jgi:hypothetical protein
VGAVDGKGHRLNQSERKERDRLETEIEYHFDKGEKLE